MGDNAHDFAAQYEDVRADNTVAQYRRVAQHFDKYLKRTGRTVDDIVMSDMQDYVRWMLKAKKSPATIRNYVTISKIYCEWLRSTGVPVPEMARPLLPRIENGRKEVLTEDLIPVYIDACLRHTDDPIATALILLPMTGLRVSEMCLLKKSDVIIGPRSSAVPIGTAQFQFKGKGNKYRRVPVLSEGIPYLLSYFAEVRPTLGRNRWLFPASRSPDGHITRHQITKRLQLIRRETGVSELHPHLLRHTYGTILNEANFSMADIALIMGHADVRVTAKYVHPVESRLLTNVNQLSYKRKTTK